MQTIPPLKVGPFMISSFFVLHFFTSHDAEDYSKALPELANYCFPITNVSPFNSESLSINEEKKNFTRDKILGSKVLWVFNRWHIKPVQCNIIELFCGFFCQFKKQAANSQCHLIRKHACDLGKVENIRKLKSTYSLIKHTLDHKANSYHFLSRIPWFSSRHSKPVVFNLVCDNI